MRSSKFLIITAVSILLLGSGLVYITLHQTPDLTKASCQPADLGERYQFADSYVDTSLFPLTETIVESHTVTLIDQQLSYTVLKCSILRYPDEGVAQHALDSICTDRQDHLKIGDEACAFATNAPANLAFRRNAFLVLMSGDIGGITGPATAVDARLQR